MIKCITYCDSSNILLQITVPFGVVTNYVEKLLQITAGITNHGVIRNYVITTTLSLFQLFLLMKQILYLMFHMFSANLYVSFCVSYFICYLSVSEKSSNFCLVEGTERKSLMIIPSRKSKPKKH